MAVSGHVTCVIKTKINLKTFEVFLIVIQMRIAYDKLRKRSCLINQERGLKNTAR